jgi:hypothetical protein
MEPIMRRRRSNATPGNLRSRVEIRRDVNALAKAEGLSSLARRAVLTLCRDAEWPWPPGHPVGAVVETELIEHDWYPIELTTGFGAGVLDDAQCRVIQVHLLPIARAAFMAQQAAGGIGGEG